MIKNPEFILDSLPGYVFTKDHSRRYTYANKLVCDFFGKKHEEIIGHLDEDFFDPDASKIIRKNDDTVLNTGLVVEEIQQLKISNSNQYRVFSTIKSPIYEGDKIIGLIGVAVDITDNEALKIELTEKEKLLNEVMDNTESLIYMKDYEGKYLYVNPPVAEFFNHPIDWIIGKTDFDIFNAEIAQKFRSADQEVLHLNQRKRFEEVGETNQGKRYFVSVKIPLPDTSTGHSKLLGISTDITAIAKLRLFEKFRGNILEMIASGKPLNEVLTTIIQGVEQNNPDMICSIMLVSEDGKHLACAYSQTLPDPYIRSIQAVPIGTGHGSCGSSAAMKKRVIVEDIGSHPYWKNYRNFAADAGLKACWSEPIVSSKNEILGTFAIYHRYTCTPDSHKIAIIESSAKLASIAIEKSRTEAIISDFAFHDSLTNLPNRRLLEDRIAMTQAASERSGLYSAVLLLDLDNFKPLNDTHGHLAGDLLLIDVARRLVASVRSNDTVARIGGDEFVVVLTQLDSQLSGAEKKALKLAEKIRMKIAEPYSIKLSKDSGHEAVSHECTASIGITLFQDSKSDIDQLIMQADKAMYQAKAQGRNKTCVYHHLV